MNLGDGVIVRLPGEGACVPRPNGGTATYTASGTEPEGAERKRGGRRTDAACSNAYASRIKVGSLNGRPRKLMPTGRSKA